MGLRITTWNVNGIRNPFSYQPWRDKRSFEAMFDTLEADIVVFQETKIQRKDLRDDMVLVAGWDCYFSLPKHKKGYSGVVIYTRNATCAPIRAEEGVTGYLCPPSSSTPFCELPDDEQIGGYPSMEQLSQSEVDAATLDSEGRCVVLEFPAFVLVGVYSPAQRDETRTDFRLGFLNALDARIRNLVAMGKRVFLTGDLNIARSERDSAHALEEIRKGGMTAEEYVSAPSRRLFNQLIDGGIVIGEREEGRERPVMWDICRAFHTDRKGMYTCWETRVNARPGNYGGRIDYVLSSLDMKSWFEDSNIQEGLMGSDHCPVYATFKDVVAIDGSEVHLRDLMNPVGTFEDGKRMKEYSPKNYLPTSGKLIPEFDRRRTIKDMFFRKASSQGNPTPTAPSNPSSASESPGPRIKTMEERRTYEASSFNPSNTPESKSPSKASAKRMQKNESVAPPPAKRSKPGSTSVAATVGKGQQSLKGFFRPKPSGSQDKPSVEDGTSEADVAAAAPSVSASETDSQIAVPLQELEVQATESQSQSAPTEEKVLVDPIVSKESWSRLFTKKAAPTCESHDEPCITLTTKKPGVNCGRSFFICPRPLGPSGNKEKGTQWRCPTFIWCSDWNAPA